MPLGHGTGYTPLFWGIFFFGHLDIRGASPPLLSLVDISLFLSFLQHQRQLSEHDSCSEESSFRGRRKGDDGTNLSQQSLVIS
jgi:hypothetical protein